WAHKRTTQGGPRASNTQGFRYVFVQGAAGFGAAFAELALRLMKEEAQREFAADAPLPRVPLLTIEETNSVVEMGVRAVNVARAWLERGNPFPAEAYFHEAW